MEKVRNFLWISYALSTVLYGFGMINENIDVVALSVGCTLTSLILLLPFVSQFGKNRKLITEIFHLTTILCGIAFCIGILSNRVMLCLTIGAFALATFASVFLEFTSSKSAKTSY